MHVFLVCFWLPLIVQNIVDIPCFTLLFAYLHSSIYFSFAESFLHIIATSSCSHVAQAPWGQGCSAHWAPVRPWQHSSHFCAGIGNHEVADHRTQIAMSDRIKDSIALIDMFVCSADGCWCDRKGMMTSSPRAKLWEDVLALNALIGFASLMTQQWHYRGNFILFYFTTQEIEYFFSVILDVLGTSVTAITSVLF